MVAAGALLVPGVLWLVAAPAGPPPAKAVAFTPSSSPGGVGKPIGMAGCAAAACHGGSAVGTLTGANRNGDRWPCSATHWMAADPHTRAYKVLEGKLATDIMARLTGTTNSPATADARCLACHTNPALAGDVGLPPARVQELRAEGVGCEACHGNASGWQAAHTGFTTATRATAFTDLGMANLSDLGERAVACAGCHVGAPADGKGVKRGYPTRDMNHDMIAAGHPRLNFEFADYLHRLPAHWRERGRGDEFPIVAWVVGRVATAEAACRLLADRADRGAWPEFAEFNCFACHHNLEPAGWRRTEPGRAPGSLPWQPLWPVTRTDDFRRLKIGPVENAAGAVDGLLKAMQKPRPPAPGTANPPAMIAADLLAEVRREVVKSAGPDVARATRELFRGMPLDRLDWDTACQVYHGLAALERTRPNKQAMNPGFDAAFKQLRLPRTPERFDSPMSFTPEQGRAALLQLLEALKKAD